ncbi:MAG TPA: hypothetical protein EYN54_02100 [Methylococcaceae bacterium]|nr:hypothetical protein [Methylococcaceae bacterium]
MIKKADLASALRNNAQAIANANSYNLIVDGREYKPSSTEEYTTEHTLFGDDNKIGMEDGSNDFQIGIYQLTVNVPRNKSNLRALDIVDTFTLGFVRGTELTVNGQMVRMMESSVTALNYNQTHLMYAISIKYSVIH